MTLTLESFIERSQAVHGSKYDYSKVILINVNAKVIIICPNHGDFEQRPIGHYNGKGCEKCAYELKNKKMSEMKIKKAADEFLDRAIEIHGNRFNYSKVIYTRHNKNIIIICSIHGEFLQTPSSHFNTNGCPQCSHEEKSKTYMHNQFDVIAQMAKIHDNKYDYSKVFYLGSSEKIEIICSKHGSFWQRASHHIEGRGCPTCSSSVSKVETEWLDYLNIPMEFRQVHLKIKNKTFRTDAVDIENKIIWEFYGDYWHGNPNIYSPESINFGNKKTFSHLFSETVKRETLLKEAGFKLITIWEADWKKLRKTFNH